MDAAQEVNNVSSLLFSILSIILVKNNCTLKSIDLDTGYINIIGNSRFNETNCHKDIQNIFSEYLLV